MPAPAAPVRTVAMWCPDWPVVAAASVEDIASLVPVAIVAGNRVVACSAIARVDGVRRGLLRREAQSRCPDLVLLAEVHGRVQLADMAEELSTGKSYWSSIFSSN